MRKILLFIVFAMMTARSAAQQIAAGTDVAMDACLAPSVGVEMTLAKKSSLRLNALYGKKILGQSIKAAALQPEWRVYLSGRPMYHHYVGAVGLLARYNFMDDDRRRTGDAVGVGLSFGYVLPVSERVLVGFHTSAGMAYYHQKEYNVKVGYDAHYRNAEGFPTANASGKVIMPLSIGVEVSYIIR